MSGFLLNLPKKYTLAFSNNSYATEKNSDFLNELGINDQNSFEILTNLTACAKSKTIVYLLIYPLSLAIVSEFLFYFFKTPRINIAIIVFLSILISYDLFYDIFDSISNTKIIKQLLKTQLNSQQKYFQFEVDCLGYIEGKNTKFTKDKEIIDISNENEYANTEIFLIKAFYLTAKKQSFFSNYKFFPNRSVLESLSEAEWFLIKCLGEEYSKHNRKYFNKIAIITVILIIITASIFGLILSLILKYRDNMSYDYFFYPIYSSFFCCLIFLFISLLIISFYYNRKFKKDLELTNKELFVLQGYYIVFKGSVAYLLKFAKSESYKSKLAMNESDNMIGSDFSYEMEEKKICDLGKNSSFLNVTDVTNNTDSRNNSILRDKQYDSNIVTNDYENFSNYDYEQVQKLSF